MRLPSANSPCSWMILGVLISLGWIHPSRAEEEVDFGADIRPLLSNNCYACHGPDEEHRSGGFRLDLEGSAYGEADSGEHPIVPGDLAEDDRHAILVALQQSIGQAEKVEIQQQGRSLLCRLTQPAFREERETRFELATSSLGS